MDKYEYNLKLDQIKSYVAEDNYQGAAGIVDSINWNRIRNINALIKAAEVYEKVERYEDSRSLLLLAYDRSPIGRMIVYKLAEVSIEMGDFTEAEEFYKEFIEIAPHDNLKYIIKYNLRKRQGASYSELIPILEEFKDQEYTEEWTYELAYLYHKSGDIEKCIDTCDELILWFGEGPYVERALELKMLYQPLTKIQEDKYRKFRLEREGVTVISGAEMEKAGETVHDPVAIPKIEVHPEKFNTVNLQEEIAKGMQQIMEATEKETVSDTMDNLKKIVEDIPYLQIQRDESENPVFDNIETDEEIDGALKLNFQEMLGEESDGQISLVVEEKSEVESQITGQMSIQDILDEWEKTKRAAEAALLDAEQRKLESAKARALIEAEDLMERLNDVIPKLDAGVTPKELLEEEYMQGPIEPIEAAVEAIEPAEEAVAIEEPIGIEETVTDAKEEIALAEEAVTIEEPISIEEPIVDAVEEIELAEESVGIEEPISIEEPIAEAVGEIELAEAATDINVVTIDLSGDASDTGLEIETEEITVAEGPEVVEPEVVVAEPEIAMEAEVEPEVEPEIAEESEATVDTEIAEEPEAVVEPEVAIEPKAVVEPAVVAAVAVEVAADGAAKLAEAVAEDTIKLAGVGAEKAVEATASEDKFAMAQTRRMPSLQISEELASTKSLAETQRIDPVKIKAMSAETEERPAPVKTKEITKLTDEQKVVFSYFVPVNGMEEQICSAMTALSNKLYNKNIPGTGNLIIQGESGCGKTVLAKSLIKALQLDGGHPNGKIGKVDASSLNNKEPQQLLKKVSGGCLIIEKAGEINKRTAMAMGLLMASDRNGTLIILEDTPKGIKQALSQDDGFASQFKNKISIPIFTNDELVAFARAYARELGYKIEEMAVLALYNRISNIQRHDRATTLAEVKDIVDEAIEREAHGGIKKAFSILTAKRYTDDDRIVLSERHFEEY